MAWARPSPGCTPSPAYSANSALNSFQSATRRSIPWPVPRRCTKVASSGAADLARTALTRALRVLRRCGAVAGAMNDQQSASDHLLVGLVRRHPGRHAHDTDHARFVGSPQRCAAAHRVANQHDRQIAVTGRAAVHGPANVSHRVGVLDSSATAVPAAIPETKPPHSEPCRGARRCQVTCDRHHPQDRELPRGDRFAAELPPAVKHQRGRPHRRGTRLAHQHRRQLPSAGSIDVLGPRAQAPDPSSKCGTCASLVCRSVRRP